jgi:chromosomal replication initiator protein
MTNADLWQAVLGELELLVSKANFTTWFRSTYILELEDDGVVVSVPNAFTKAWLENKYHGYILTALQRLTGSSISNITYRVATPAPTQASGSTQGVGRPEQQMERHIAATEPDKNSAPNKGAFNQKYTFDRFIVGKNNELAYAACRAVAAGLGKTYNPLFLYGGVGLGKTHLIQAIGNEVLSNNPDLRVVFTTCEHFTNNFVQSIREGSIDQFKRNYREIDLLLVDDVQFLVNKEQTQEEFFHTFNALHQLNKQIILTSDRPPKSIASIENRLVSRFEWGMIADVGKPDLETRVAIIQRQIQERNLPLNPDVIAFIAESITNNVREIEGALTKLHAYYQLNTAVPNIEVARSLLASLQVESGGAVTPKKVIQSVATYFDVTLDNLMGSSRRKELVMPRQVAMYLLREECSSSFPSIGQELGGRDHTTAMHACAKIRHALETSSRLRADIEQIKIAFGGSS